MKGEWITLDGSDGSVYSGQVELIRPEPPKAYETLMKWADKVRKLGVRTNADTPQDARVAREMGAEGIGLCRTEHMFFKDFEHPEKSIERQRAIQEMILADTSEARRKALDKLLAVPAARLHRDFRGHERISGDHSADRSAAARVRPARSRETGRAGEENWHLGGSGGAPGGATSRSEPDAGPSRLPALRSRIRKFSRCRFARSSKRRSIAKNGRLK